MTESALPLGRQAFSGTMSAASSGVLIVACWIGFAGTPIAAQEHGRHGHERHAVAHDAKLTSHIDADAGVLTVRLGPLGLPARSHHDAVAQAPNRFLEVPFDGWLTAYTPRLVDGDGQPVPGRLLHHVGFWNASRSDFLCPNKEEHIFGAGGEMNEWVPVPGHGYRVRPGERIRVNSMFHNPTDRDYPEVYLEVDVAHRRIAAGPELENVYPVWFDVQECGDSEYDLPAGPSTAVGEIEVPVAGTLLGVGGHLHDYGRRLDIESITRDVELATLEAETDQRGRLVSMPIVPFFLEGGRRLAEGERLRVTATYENPTGERIEGGAMGIVVGLFRPDDPSRMEAFRRDDSR